MTLINVEMNTTLLIQYFLLSPYAQLIPNKSHVQSLHSHAEAWAQPAVLLPEACPWRFLILPSTYVGSLLSMLVTYSAFWQVSTWPLEWFSSSLSLDQEADLNRTYTVQRAIPSQDHGWHSEFQLRS